MAKMASKPKIKSVDMDALFGEPANSNPTHNNSANDKPANKSSTFNISGVLEIPIADLVDFEGHPFHVNKDEALDDLVESIKVHGVLTPVLVRPVKPGTGNTDTDTNTANKAGESGEGVKTEVVQASKEYEKLAGHRRTKAAEIAGLTTVPVRVFEGLSDEAALAIVIETNLMQRSFSDMCHSEKAAVIALQHSKMFSQGKRNDIQEVLLQIEELAMSESESDGYDTDTANKALKQAKNSTLSQQDKKLRTHDKVAIEYGLSKETVARYLRISKLIPSLKEVLDKGEMAFLTGVQISFLRKTEQEMLADALANHPYTIDMKKADLMREYSKKNKLHEKNILLILSGEAKPKNHKPQTHGLSKTTFEKYFTKTQTKKEIQGILDEALEMYFEQRG